MKPYTFSNYFELNVDTFDLVTKFGYSLVRTQLRLPESSGQIEQLDALKERIEAILSYVDLVKDAARREVLIAPIVLEIARITHARLSIEYPLQVNQKLQGSLDYYLRTQTQLLVIEAKQADLTRGLTQLIIELIALDQWKELTQPELLPVARHKSRNDYRR